MAITDPAAVKYCNEWIRPAADRLARCYYRAHKINDRWKSLQGTNQEKLDTMLGSIQAAAGVFERTWMFCFKADRLYNSGTIGSILPNDPLEEVWDNGSYSGQDPNRPPLTGQDARRVKLRMEEFVNWLARGTDVDKHWETDANATLPITYDFYDNIGRLANDSAKDPTAEWGRIFAIDRCEEIMAEYEVTHTANLNHILRASVNPDDNVEV